MSAAENLRALSHYFDASNSARFAGMSRDELERELLMLHRTIKVGEEFGEVVDSIIGITGANPRKGVYGHVGDAVREELDVALTALGNVEHLTGNLGLSMAHLEDHIQYVAERVGIVNLVTA